MHFPLKLNYHNAEFTDLRSTILIIEMVLTSTIKIKDKKDYINA